MNAYYRLYIKSVIRLAATLLIKDTYTASAINDRLALSGHTIDQDDPYTWKYYLNVSGRYHESDTPMTITSLDTLEEIGFTQANLAIHRATRKEYVYGSSYYKALVAKYPDQRMLINGILNPIDIATAIEADDHKILFYDPALVEPGEQQLIPGLQDYIEKVFYRWDNRDYALFEPYYYPAFLGVLYSKLPLAIMNLRKEARKTDQAHSFHIRQYLLSFSQVGAEFDFMTHKQRLWLYRNIRYLNRNLGRQEIFDKVTQKILTDRGFSLAGYNISHDYENLVTDLVPKIEMVRETLNGIDPAQGGRSKSVGEVLDLELDIARDNPDYRDEEEVEVESAAKHSLFSTLPTKVLESNVFDRSDAEPFTLTDVLLNHWIYLSHYGRYTTVVTFTNPANGDVYRLSAKNAFIFYLYAYNRALGIVLPTVPVLSANRVRRMPIPTKAELKAMVDPKKVPDYYIDKILDDQVDLDRYVSVEAFREVCVAIQRVMLRHREMRHFNPDYIAEGQLHTIIDRCYQDIRIDLAGEMDYDTWLSQQEIDISSMGKLEFDQIAQTILSEVTGADLSLTSSTRAIHAAMIRIMQALSSYSVQYIAEINDSPLKIVDGKFPKLTIPEYDNFEEIDVETPAPTILDQDAYETVDYDIDTGMHVVSHRMVEEVIAQHIPVNVNVKLINLGGLGNTIELLAPQVTLLQPDVADLSGYSQGETDIPGYDPVVREDLEDWVTGDQLVGYEQLTEARRLMLLGL